jgi:hypothetical protein
MGDSFVEGGVHASATWQTVELRSAIESMRMQATPFGLSAVDEALSNASSEAAQPRPDKERVVGFLGAAVRALKEAGALLDASTSLGVSVRRAASVLSPVGATVLALL